MSLRLEFTDSRFVFASKSYPGIPLLVDAEHRFIEPVCEYLRHLVIENRLKTSSAKTYAEYLLNFWMFLVRMKIDFRALTDRDLITWFNRQEKLGIQPPTIASRCDVVFDLYVWMERQGHVEQLVRIPGWNDMEMFVPQLTAAPAKSHPRHRRGSKFGIVSAVRPRAVNGKVQPTPTSDEVSQIYIAADNSENIGLTERNHLLIDWYVQVGLRRMEWCALTMGQIPEWDDIYSLLQRGIAHELKLTKTKGGSVRHVGVLPELLEKTREYIEGPRTDIVSRFKRKNGNDYKEPVEVFLSNKTGRPLTLRAISNLAKSWFKDAKVDGHGHRLRATYLTLLFEAEISAEEAKIAAHPGTKTQIDYELILRKVAERAGHADIDTLRHYLTLVKKRRVRRSWTEDPVTLQQKIDAMKHELAILEHRAQEYREELGIPKRPSRARA